MYWGENIIFLIGDGTGFNAIHLARLHKGGPSHKLNIDNLPYVGIVNNHSADNIYTDSAAAGTAFATGYKTNNKMLSITKDNRKLETITETLTKSGYIFGLVATSSITHATPAAFYSHVDNRYKEKIIADGDGEMSPDEKFTNYEEFLMDSNPALADTDGDNCTDGWEIYWNNNRPANETRSINLLDGLDGFLDYDDDGWEDWDGIAYPFPNWREEVANTNPWNPDTDGDSMTDGYEADNG